MALADFHWEELEEMTETEIQIHADESCDWCGKELKSHEYDFHECSECMEAHDPKNNY